MHVFLSYSGEDRRIAASLASFLGKKGYSVWWDFEKLRGGDDFREVILGALNSCQCSLVIWSETAITSDWVRDEADIARKQNKLIPLKVGTLAVERIPLGFRGIHTIDVRHRDEILAALAKFDFVEVAARRTRLQEWAAPVHSWSAESIAQEIKMVAYRQETTMRPFGPKEASVNIRRRFYCIDDIISYTSPISVRDVYVIKFAFRRSVFDASLACEENEYSWLIDNRARPDEALQHVGVRSFTVNGERCRVERPDMSVDAMTIRVVKCKQRDDHINARISYHIRTLLHRDETFFFYLAHCSIQGFEYSFDLSTTKEGPVDVMVFHPSPYAFHVVRFPEHEPTKVFIGCKGLVPKKCGGIFRW